MKDRVELIEHFARLGFVVGAEVGVLHGRFSRFMCQTIPGLKLYSIDSWGIGDKRQKMRDYHIKMYGIAKKNLAKYNATLIREPSAQAVKTFEDNSLDFVYIDANHSATSVLEDVTVWTDKIREDGIVSGHDYDRLSVQEAVDSYVEKNNYKLNIIGPDDLGRQSWWFIKKRLIKNRQELAKYFSELDLKTGVEVGVYKGGYSVDLCKANPELKLFCVDIWGINDQDQKKKDLHLKIYNYAKKKLAPYNTVLIRDFSVNAVKQFDDNSLDFVYIDAEHFYPEPNQDIEWWAEKVRLGGIVSGHDYDWVDVKKAVDEYVLKYKHKLNTTEDENCSWWFIKQ